MLLNIMLLCQGVQALQRSFCRLSALGIKYGNHLVTLKFDSRKERVK